jgi:hypothetical protein
MVSRTSRWPLHRSLRLFFLGRNLRRVSVGSNSVCDYGLCTLQICAFDHAHPRPAAQWSSFLGQGRRNCPKVHWQPRDCQSGLLEYVVQPCKTNIGLEGILTRFMLSLDCREQRRNNVRKAVGGGRGSGGGSLGAICRYLRLRTCCESEALMRR